MAKQTNKASKNQPKTQPKQQPKQQPAEQAKEQPKQQTRKQQPKRATEKKKLNYALGKENYRLLAISFGIIVLGFILMIGGKLDDPNKFYPDGDPSKTPEVFSFRRITLGPVLALLGFIFGIFAIMKKPKNSEAETPKN